MNEFAEKLMVSPSMANHFLNLTISGRSYRVNYHDEEVHERQGRFRRILRQCFGDRAAERREMKVWTLLTVARFEAARRNAPERQLTPTKPAPLDPLSPPLPASSLAPSPSPSLPEPVPSQQPQPSRSDLNQQAYSSYNRKIEGLVTRAEDLCCKAEQLLMSMRTIAEKALVLRRTLENSAGVNGAIRLTKLVTIKTAFVDSQCQLMQDEMTKIKDIAVSAKTLITAHGSLHHLMGMHLSMTAEMLHMKQLYLEMQRALKEVEKVNGELEQLASLSPKPEEIWETTI